MCGPLIVLLKDNPKQLYEHMHVKVRVYHIMKKFERKAHVISNNFFLKSVF